MERKKSKRNQKQKQQNNYEKTKNVQLLNKQDKEIAKDLFNDYKMLDDEYYNCWKTGNYIDQDCYTCPYACECSGYSGDEEDED